MLSRRVMLSILLLIIMLIIIIGGIIYYVNNNKPSGGGHIPGGGGGSSTISNQCSNKTGCACSDVPGVGWSDHYQPTPGKPKCQDWDNSGKGSWCYIKNYSCMGKDGCTTAEKGTTDPDFNIPVAYKRCNDE